MVNGLPSWVQQPQQGGANRSAVQPYTNGIIAGPNSSAVQPYSSGNIASGGSSPSTAAGSQSNVAAPTPAQQVHNPNAWDGIGPNTNQNQAHTPVSNFGAPISGASVGNLNLPQNIQQILQMFQQMNGSGFQGLQPVNGNPFANVGSNLNSWGTASGPGGIYGGT